MRNLANEMSIMLIMFLEGRGGEGRGGEGRGRDGARRDGTGGEESGGRLRGLGGWGPRATPGPPASLK